MAEQFINEFLETLWNTIIETTGETLKQTLEKDLQKNMPELNPQDKAYQFALCMAMFVISKEAIERYFKIAIKAKGDTQT